MTTRPRAIFPGRTTYSDDSHFQETCKMMSETFLFPTPPKSRAARILEALHDRIEARHKRIGVARSLRALDRLDDRLLGDIGLTRADVEKMLAADRGRILAGISGRPFRRDGI
jgi:uncharacterized protein YjiS (DUF1127 family)